jgi:beta-1,4-mannosyl-glycoprotein beta-1,4-N-acetylglucosaminyltransferase
MSIYDCFMYYDEDLILDLRLNLLNNYVKKFILVEANYTHSGKKRNFNFDINKFQKFKNKIIYIQVKEPPLNIKNYTDKDDVDKKNSIILDNALIRENFQRNQISKGLNECLDDDLVLIGDIDEIPSIENFKHKNKITIFLQKMFYYKFNLMHPTMTWIGTKACKKKDLISPQWLRNISSKKYALWRLDTLFSKKKYFNLNFINDGGWHFTSLKRPEDVHFKLSNFLHHLEFEESNISIEDLKKIIKEKKVMYDHSADKRDNKWNSSISLVKIEDHLLPKYLIQNKVKYSDFFD